MKNNIFRVSAMLLAGLLIFCACAKQNAPADASAQSSSTGLANPLVEVDSYEELRKAVPEVILSDAPKGATGIRYTYINMEPRISEIVFTYGGDEYTYRAAKIDNKDEKVDISGVYDELNVLHSIESNVTNGGSYTLRCSDTNSEGLAQWYDESTGCTYSLFTRTGCDESQQIEEVVDLLIKTDAASESMPTPTDKASGKVKGKLISAADNTIVVNAENGSSLVFLLTQLYNVEAKPGDLVEVAYSGSLAEAPEAIKVTVLQAGSEEKTLNGIISQFDDSFMHIQTETGNVYGFLHDEATRFTGASKDLKLGNIVTVTYKGDLDNLPAAQKINTVKIGDDAPDPLANKKLQGKVKSLATKAVTLLTDSGSVYTFTKDTQTRITGDYDLKIGAVVQVTYDGYASKAPRAKTIKVLAPPDPTPPSPSPTYLPVQYYTVQGTVLVKNGNALSVRDASGNVYSFLLGNAQVIGSGYPGAFANVTYYYEPSRGNVVTRVIYTAITPTAAPVHRPTAPPVPIPTAVPVPIPTAVPIRTVTVDGVVIMQAGNALSIQTDSGAVLSFLLGAPAIEGSGGEGDYVTLTYTEYGNEQTVTRIVYHRLLDILQSLPDDDDDDFDYYDYDDDALILDVQSENEEF